MLPAPRPPRSCPAAEFCDALGDATATTAPPGTCILSYDARQQARGAPDPLQGLNTFRDAYLQLTGDDVLWVGGFFNATAAALAPSPSQVIDASDPPAPASPASPAASPASPTASPAPAGGCPEPGKQCGGLCIDVTKVLRVVGCREYLARQLGAGRPVPRGPPGARA